MKSDFKYMTDCIFRYRLYLVIIIVIILHAQVFFQFSEQTKIQGHDFTPQKVISAALILKSGAKSLASANLISNDLSTVHVPLSKSVQTDVTNKTNRSDTKEETISAPNLVKNKNISSNADHRKSSDSRKSADSMKSADSRKSADSISSTSSSKSAVLIESSQAESEELAENRPDLNIMGHMPIQVANPRFKHSRPAPAYPQQALRLREEGLVVIRVLISKNGQVTQAIVQQSSGSAWLDSAAKHASLKAQFYPHIIDGVAHQTQADLPFRFLMK